MTYHAPISTLRAAPPPADFTPEPANDAFRDAIGLPTLLVWIWWGLLAWALVAVVGWTLWVAALALAHLFGWR